MSGLKIKIRTSKKRKRSSADATPLETDAQKQARLKKRKLEKNKSEWKLETSTTKYSDVGGIEKILQDIRELVEYPLLHPEIYEHIGVKAPCGILLHGPPGCGKTLLAHAVAGELQLPFFKISAPEIVSGMSGQSETKIRLLFANAKKAAPSILFFDEIDAITPKRDNASRQMDTRIVAQLLTCLDELARSDGPPVMILAATNRPDAMDEALRRAGRFDREIKIGIPDEIARERIIRVLAKDMRVAEDFGFHALAKKTHGFVGADLQALTKEAASICINRIFGLLMEQDESEELEARQNVSNFLRTRKDPLSAEELQSLAIETCDFFDALKNVQPSAKREGFSTIPNVSWDDIGALQHLREQLRSSILQPILNPRLFIAMNVKISCGVLLYGPPGCGKTLVAKAVAAESGASFISIKGPELLSKFVGESERAVRQLFQRASASLPCVLFFDELDALAPNRGKNDTPVAERVVNQLLTELDGLESRGAIFVVGATNRPDMIDAAMLRPGRLDKLLYVPLPEAQGRVDIMKKLLRKTKVSNVLKVEDIALDKRCEGFSGADIASLIREASLVCIKEFNEEPHEEDDVPELEASHFEKAFVDVLPSVSEESNRHYLSLKHKLRQKRKTAKVE